MGEAERVDSTIDTDLVARAEFIIAALGGEYMDWIRGGLGQLDNLLSQAWGSVRVVDDLVAAYNNHSQGGSSGFLMISHAANNMHTLSEAQDGFLDAKGETTGRELLALMHLLDEEQENKNAALMAGAECAVDRALLECGGS